MKREEIEAERKKTGKTRAAIVAEHEHAERMKAEAAKAAASAIDEPTDIDEGSDIE